MHELPTVEGGSDLKIDRLTNTNHLVGSVRVGSNRMGFMWRPGEDYKLIAPNLNIGTQLRIADVSTSGKIAAVQRITNYLVGTEQLVTFGSDNSIW
jgi:hypothetical protein